MYKKILLSALFISSLFGIEQNFIEPSEAFKVGSQEYKEKVTIELKLANDIYVYDEFLKVLNGKEDITKKLSFKKPVEFHGFIVHFDTVAIDIPRKLITDTITLEYQGCSTAGLCYTPMEKIFNFIKAKPIQKVNEKSKPKVNETDTITQTLKTGSVFLVLITFFGFGLLLALTPCIFPMIPILSSIIVHHTKKNEGKMSTSRGFFLSLVYVLSMSVAYTVAGVLAGLFGANIQAMLQNPFVISGFALVFVALAFSMFGYYEIALPQSWQTKLNKTSEESSKGDGIAGIAVMGFLSALIVGPCVAPPLAGALVYIGQTGDALLGGLALFVMSLGMGMPLLVIGAGSGKYMPKPGGWMTTVSKIFGVVMLGVAIWMLDKIVPEIVTAGLFMILLLGSAFYLVKNGNKFGKIVAVILVVLSMLLSYNTLNDNQADKLHFKYVKTVQELEKIVSTSKKPIMVDFWATWCVSCIEFDKVTFADDAVKSELSKYLLLKVDVTKNTSDDTALMKKFNLFGPPALIFYNNGKEEKLKRVIGFKNAEEFLEIVK
ncbi:MAG: protein-disulfide reductase DsbD [Arcobacteraceae bacterium]|nr:protein-disulfide reductase DsbD [Arcobacteraceae bacterium]